MNGNIIVFGGSGGLGAPLAKEIQRINVWWHVTPVSSKDCDVTKENEVVEFLADKDPEVVINLAVQNVDGLLEHRDTDSIKKQLDVNIMGNINVFRASIPLMKKYKFGRLIFISSILSKTPIRGTSIYSASKAFNDNLVRCTAKENARYGITANSIQLGYFDGGLTKRVPEPVMTQVMEHIPLKRLGTIDELYKAVMFLVDTEYVTGTNLLMAGGLE